MELNKKVLLLVSTMLSSITGGSYAYAGGVRITGDAVWNGDQSFTGTGGVNEGIYMEDAGLTAKVTANGNIEAVGNGWRGLHGAAGNLTIENTETGKTLTLTGNGERGLEVGKWDTSGASVTIKNMNADISNNGAIDSSYGAGVMAGSGSSVTFVGGSSGSVSNYLKANNNVNSTGIGAGIVASGVKDGLTATVNIKNMDVEASNNGRIGIVAVEGGAINIVGNGSNVLKADGHTNSSDLFGGAGVYAKDLKSSVNITDMEIAVQGNRGVGFFAEDGASIKISSSTGDNTLSVINSGRAVSVNGVNGGVSSSIDIDNMNVVMTGNHHGILVNSGGKINFTNSKEGNALQISNSSDEGVLVLNADGAIASTLTIQDMDISVSNNGKAGIKAETGGQINISSLSGANKLKLYDNAQYGLLVTGAGASINISDMDVSGRASGDALMGIENGGTYNFTNSTISTENGSLFYISSNDASVNKVVLDGTKAVSLGTNLFTIDSNNAEIEAKNSYLENRIFTQSGKVSNVAMTNSQWVMKEASNITNFTVSKSKIDLRKSGGFNQLTLSSLSSNASDYYINTYFNAAGDRSDKIIVDGGAATGIGNVLHVTSTGYDGAKEINGYGIQVVNLDNATNKDIGFRLHGGVIDSGAYEYALYKAEDNNYYLQNTKVVTTIMKTIANMPAMHLSIIKTGMNELRKRMGELRNNNSENKDGFWFRSYAKSLKVDDTINSKMNLYGMEAGYDKQLYSTCDNKVYAGVMAGYLYTDNIKYRQSGYYNNNAHANTPSIGLYGTWLNQSGWFADATVRHFWSNMDANNFDSQGSSIKYSPDRNFMTASFEAGRQMEYVLDEKSKIIFEPKAEVQYAYAKAKDFSTRTHALISYGETESLSTRAAVRFGYNLETDSNIVLEPFAEVGISKEWSGNTDVEYAGGYYDSKLGGTGYDIALGLHTKINDNFNTYADVTYETGTVYEGVSGQIGIRYNW